VHADSHGASKLRLGHRDEPTQHRDIIAGFDATFHQPSVRAGRDCSGELRCSEFWNFSHVLSPT
jgi:hypothetical protein